ncbi:metallophosphoesterase family protein [Algoriphagus namhaensis]
MLKILHTADWHLGKRLQEYPRIAEQRDVLHEICEIADQEEVDLVILAGDIFDTFNPSHEAVELLYKTLRKLSKNGTRPIIAISGNHDSTQFVEAPDPLARELGIFFYGKYDSIIPVEKWDTGLAVTQSEPGFVELRIPHIDFPIRLILAPYASELLLKTYLGEEDREGKFRQLLADKWASLAAKYCDDQGINLLTGHFFFVKEGEKPQQEPESERPILHVGGAQALYSHLIPQQIQYVALGHLHRYQVVDSQPCPLVYSSSPLAYSFSEADQEKKVVLIEAEPAKPVNFRAISLQSGRPLLRKRFEELAQAIDWLEAHPYSFVELTFVTEEAIDAQTRKAIMSAHDGIVSLIPELKSKSSAGTASMSATDLSADMLTLFTKYYESSKGIKPNAELLEVFKEVIAQNEPS